MQNNSFQFTAGVGINEYAAYESPNRQTGVSIKSDCQTKDGFVANLHSTSTASTRGNGASRGDYSGRPIDATAEPNALTSKTLEPT